jgi:hypothetical protein
MKKIRILLSSIIALLSIMSLPTIAYAGDLSAWSNYFTYARAKSNTEHFALWKN